MKLKKLSAILAAIVVCAAMTACNGTDSIGETTTVHTPIATKVSPDKYTYYLKDYVGRNCASFGSGWGSQILERYGEGRIYFNIVTDDGSYADVNDKNSLSQYIVTGQSVEPNTEIKYVFKINSDGEEYGSIDTQSLEEVDLYVSRINSETTASTSENKSNEELTTTTTDTETTISETTVSETTAVTTEKKQPTATSKEPHTPVALKASPDRYTFYVKDYIGKNCALLGHKWGSHIVDRTSYGDGELNLNLITTDGSFIDLEDEEVLKNYYVTGQSIEPNTEIKLAFFKDDEGNEIEGLVVYQSIEEIDLYVSLVE